MDGLVAGMDGLVVPENSEPAAYGRLFHISQHRRLLRIHSAVALSMP
jgi:hypothetical protein